MMIAHLESSAVVDTGATTSFLPADGIIMLVARPPLEDVSVEVLAADNTCFKVSHKVKIEMFPSEFPMSPRTVVAYVVDNKVDLLGHDHILGNKDIKSFGLNIISVGNQLLVMKNQREIGREESHQSNNTIAAALPSPDDDRINAEREQLYSLLDSYKDTFAETIEAVLNVNR